MHFETRAVHTGVYKDAAYNSCITPIYPSSTFCWDDLNSNRGFDYTRSGNPTRDLLIDALADLVHPYRHAVPHPGPEPTGVEAFDRRPLHRERGGVAKGLPGSIARVLVHITNQQRHAPHLAGEVVDGGEKIAPGGPGPRGPG